MVAYMTLAWWCVMTAKTNSLSCQRPTIGKKRCGKKALLSEKKDRAPRKKGIHSLKWVKLSLPQSQIKFVGFFFVLKIVSKMKVPASQKKWIIQRRFSSYNYKIKALSPRIDVPSQSRLLSLSDSLEHTTNERTHTHTPHIQRKSQHFLFSFPLLSTGCFPISPTSLPVHSLQPCTSLCPWIPVIFVLVYFLNLVQSGVDSQLSKPLKPSAAKIILWGKS